MGWGVLLDSGLIQKAKVREGGGGGRGCCRFLARYEKQGGGVLSASGLIRKKRGEGNILSR